MSRELVKGRTLSTTGDRLMVHVANLGERCIQDLLGKPEGKRLLGRPRHRWEDNLKWVLKKWDEDHGLNRCGSG
jgi:hypothetical protein